MKAKPKGARYRNLFARGGAIYYERVVGGKRIRRSCETADWAFAAQVRDAFEQRKGIGRLPVLPAEAPRLDEFALRYLAEDTSHLAPTDPARSQPHPASRWSGDSQPWSETPRRPHPGGTAGVVERGGRRGGT